MQRSLGGSKDAKAPWQQGKQEASGRDGPGGKAGKPLKRSAGGKRPAVAARKQGARLAAKGGVQKQQA